MSLAPAKKNVKTPWTKLAATARTGAGKFYEYSQAEDFPFIAIPIIIMLVSFIGLLLSQVANCKFASPFDHFLFGMKPEDRILG